MAKKIIFTKHALERMLKRGISQERVIEIIKNPSISYPIQQDNTQELRKEISSKKYYVVVEHKKNALIIITTGINNE